MHGRWSRRHGSHAHKTGAGAFAWADRRFLTALAEERGETKTEIVVEALECLRRQLIERRMEAGYRDLADEERQLVTAGLAASLPTIPD